MKKIFGFSFFIFSLSCTHRSKMKEIVLDEKGAAYCIIINKNDSQTLKIFIDSALNLENLNAFKKENGHEISNEQQVKFYENGKVALLLESVNGIPNGHTYKFYKSGALKNNTFYVNGRPLLNAIEYWDDNFGLFRESIHFYEDGQIAKIKVFDSLGHYLRDSIPMNRDYIFYGK